jgi:hypothetical protein
MNCSECRDRLVALSENLLAACEQQACRAHLELCAGCRAEYAAIARLERRLVAHGQWARGVDLTAGVRQRINGKQTTYWEIIMSKLVRHRWSFGLGAAAGMAAAALAILVAVSPKAFGVDQVIAAYAKIQTIHVKTFAAGSSSTNEYWIQCDGQGRAERARYHFPQTEDGEKLITWTPEKTEIWFKGKNGFRVMQTSRIAPMMQQLLDGSQPKLVMEKLDRDTKAGNATVQTQEPGPGQTNALIIAEYKDKQVKFIYYVDRQTDLISRTEQFRQKGAQDVLQSTTEFSDYNVPLDPQMFELRGELTPGVRISDQLNQLIGMPQGNLTDEQAATEAVRQFFQAIKDQDYKTAGLIYSGQQEADTKRDFGSVTIAKIISVGPAVLQTNWEKRGYRVPSRLEIARSGGETYVSEPGPYVRPGDDEAHPDRWNITGGVNFMEGTAGEGNIKVLPDNEKYAAMTPEQAARAFFEACNRKDWTEAGKFLPMTFDDRIKDFLGGLTIVSIGESFTADKYPGHLAPSGYPGRYVPYVIQLAPQEANIRVANTNAAKRFVLTGLYDAQRKLQQELNWSTDPETLTNNDVYARLSAKEAVQAYFDAQAKLDWTEMAKFTTPEDVAQTKQQAADAEKAGLDPLKDMPTMVAEEATWVPEQSAWFVKCRFVGMKKWYLALRNDNAAHRWQVDGGF